MFGILRSEMARQNGLGREVLLQADAMSGDVIEAFTAMDRAANEAFEEVREKEMAAARNQPKRR